jgi:hypothetical protein
LAQNHCIRSKNNWNKVDFLTFWSKMFWTYRGTEHEFSFLFHIKSFLSGPAQFFERFQNHFATIENYNSDNSYLLIVSSFLQICISVLIITIWFIKHSISPSH